jgi:hypothetical protein
MARIFEPTPEQEAQWQEWLASRPESVREVAKRFEPWSLYRIKTGGQRVTIHGFNVDKEGQVTLTVCITGEFNLISFERQTFGISPDDLEPCDLPLAHEPVGALLTEQTDIDDFIDVIKQLMSGK